MFTDRIKKIISGVLAFVLCANVVFGMTTQVAYAANGSDSTTGQSDSGLWSNLTSVLSPIQYIAEKSAKMVGDITLRGAGFLAWISASLLNFSVNIGVTNMSASVKGFDGIDLGWRTLRDLANIVFIFVLIYVSIGIILRLSSVNSRAMLPRVIIVAFLVNFSLFFAQFVIDISNRLALEFYDMAGFNSIEAGAADGSRGFAEVILTSTRVGTIYDVDQRGNSGGGVLAGLGAEAGGSGTIAEVFADKPVEFVLIQLVGSLFLAVLAFVLLAAAFMLLARFIILIFLMILSPLAFVAMVLPQTQSHARKWWSTLFKQAFFAPAYFLMVWVAMSVVQSDQFVQATGLGRDSDAGFAQLILGQATPVVFNYVLVIGFLVAALILAKNMGAYGASAFVKWGDAVRQRVTNTVTRTATLPVRATGAVAGAVGRAAGGGAARYALSKTLVPLRKNMERTTARMARGDAGKSAQWLAKNGLYRNVVGEATGAMRNMEKKKFFGARSMEEQEKFEKGFTADSQKELRKEDRAHAIDAYKKLAAEHPDDLREYIKDYATEEEKKVYSNFEKQVRRMTPKEAAGMDADDLKGLAHILTEQQMKEIEKTEDKTTNEKEEIWEARFKDFTDAFKEFADVEQQLADGRLSQTDGEAQKAAIEDKLKPKYKNLTKYDLENFGDDRLTNKNFVKQANSKMMENIMSSDNIAPTVKAKVREERGKVFGEAVAHTGSHVDMNNITQQGLQNFQRDAEKMRKYFQNFKPKDLAGLGKDVYSTEPNMEWSVLGLTVPTLKAMTEDADPEVRQNVRAHIETVKAKLDRMRQANNGVDVLDPQTRNQFDKLHDWISQDQYGRFFGF